MEKGGSRKEEAYFSDLCERNLLTLTRTKILAVDSAYAADRRSEKWRLYQSQVHCNRTLQV
jgi:hypothetical protein